jgi:hypothetical protein
MTKPGTVYQLYSRKSIVDLTKEEVGTTSVRKQLVVVVRYVSEREDVELRFTSTTCDVDRKQYREGDAAADQTSNDSHLQQTQEQITIQRMMKWLNHPKSPSGSFGDRSRSSILPKKVLGR